MTNWQAVLAPWANNVEKVYDALRYRMQYRLGGPGPIKIVPYNGYGRSDRLFLQGRVLEDRHEIISQPGDTLWNNLVNMYRRIETDEVPHARVHAQARGADQVVEADEEGFFQVWLDFQTAQTTDQLWQPIELELISPVSRKQVGPVRTTGRVLVPPPSARFAVISDIDDTVIQTDATHLLRMARTVFLGNARTRLPFPGVAAFYRALYAGESGSEQNPLFYISSSPWNLYDLLVEFFHLQNIPIGPVLFLRDFGLTSTELVPTDNYKHKIGLIRRTLDLYPDLPFILIGDSGQQDPEIYTQVVEEHPRRILAVYIRNVTRDLKRPAAIRALAEKVVKAGSYLVLADDTYSIAQHALEQHFIPAYMLPSIHYEKKQDEQPPSALETALGTAPKAEGPTVVVKGQETSTPEKPIEPEAIKQALKETGDEKKQKTPTVVVKPEKKEPPQKRQNSKKRK